MVTGLLSGQEKSESTTYIKQAVKPCFGMPKQERNYMNTIRVN